jgi:hypothetical protein
MGLKIEAELLGRIKSATPPVACAPGKSGELYGIHRWKKQILR